jgi:hypothetical protein
VASPNQQCRSALALGSERLLEWAYRGRNACAMCGIDRAGLVRFLSRHGDCDTSFKK